MFGSGNAHRTYQVTRLLSSGVDSKMLGHACRFVYGHYKNDGVVS